MFGSKQKYRKHRNMYPVLSNPLSGIIIIPYILCIVTILNNINDLFYEECRPHKENNGNTTYIDDISRTKTKKFTYHMYIEYVGDIQHVIKIHFSRYSSYTTLTYRDLINKILQDIRSIRATKLLKYYEVEYFHRVAAAFPTLYLNTQPHYYNLDQNLYLIIGNKMQDTDTENIEHMVDCLLSSDIDTLNLNDELSSVDQKENQCLFIICIEDKYDHRHLWNGVPHQSMDIYVNDDHIKSCSKVAILDMMNNSNQSLSWMQLTKYTKLFTDYRNLKYNVAVHLLIQHNRKRLNQNDITWLLCDIIEKIIISIKTNENVCEQIFFILPISQMLKPKGIFMIVTYTARYNDLKELLQCIISHIINNKNHWVYKSTIMLASIDIIQKKIRKTYKKTMQNCIKWKMDPKMLNRLCILSEKSTKCTIFSQELHGSLDHNKQHKQYYQLMIKYLIQIITHKLTKCNHTRCLNRYISFKYGDTVNKVITQHAKFPLSVENKWYLCKRCRLVYYCSRKCQKRDWSRHKNWCLILK